MVMLEIDLINRHRGCQYLLRCSTKALSRLAYNGRRTRCFPIRNWLLCKNFELTRLMRLRVQLILDSTDSHLLGFHPMIWCCDGKTFAKSCLELYGVDSKFVVWSGRAESLVLIHCDHIRANETRVV